MTSIQRLTDNKTWENIDNWASLKTNDIVRRIDDNGISYEYNERVTNVAGKNIYVEMVK